MKSWDLNSNSRRAWTEPGWKGMDPSGTRPAGWHATAQHCSPRRLAIMIGALCLRWRKFARALGTEIAIKLSA